MRSIYGRAMRKHAQKISKLRRRKPNHRKAGRLCPACLGTGRPFVTWPYCWCPTCHGLGSLPE